jgi:hypothetical protein
MGNENLNPKPSMRSEPEFEFSNPSSTQILERADNIFLLTMLVECLSVFPFLGALLRNFDFIPIFCPF